MLNQKDFQWVTGDLDQSDHLYQLILVYLCALYPDYFNMSAKLTIMKQSVKILSAVEA